MSIRKAVFLVLTGCLLSMHPFSLQISALALENGIGGGGPAIPTHLARPVARAGADLARALGVPTETIEVVEAREVTWPNDCLGLPSAGTCGGKETRGLRIYLRAMGRDYEFRSDGKGQLRFAGPGAKPEFAKPVEAARRELADYLKISSKNIEVLRVETIVWADTCLGLPAPELCAPRATAGYRITFSAAGKEFHYHSDRDELIRFAGPGDIPRLKS